MKASGSAPPLQEPKQNNIQALYDYTTFDGSMHLPQLFSPESVVPPSFISPMSLNNMDIECSQNLLRLTTASGCGLMQQERYNGDWSFLDKLLASHQTQMDHHHHQHQHQHPQTKCHPSSLQLADHVGTSTHQQKFPFQYLGCETDILKFSKWELFHSFSILSSTFDGHLFISHSPSYFIFGWDSIPSNLIKSFYQNVYTLKFKLLRTQYS